MALLYDTKTLRCVSWSLTTSNFYCLFAFGSQKEDTSKVDAEQNTQRGGGAVFFFRSIFSLFSTAALEQVNDSFLLCSQRCAWLCSSLY